MCLVDKKMDKKEASSRVVKRGLCELFPSEVNQENWSNNYDLVVGWFKEYKQIQSGQIISCRDHILLRVFFPFLEGKLTQR